MVTPDTPVRVTDELTEVGIEVGIEVGACLAELVEWLQENVGTVLAAAPTAA